MNDTMSFGVHRLWKDYFLKRLGPSNNTQLVDVAGGTGTLKHQTFLSFSANVVYCKLLGDIAFRFLKHVNYSEGRKSEMNNNISRKAHVTVIDINQAMLDVGMKRAREQNYLEGKFLDRMDFFNIITFSSRSSLSGISWIQGDAEQLPVESEKFDAYTIAFGIRNCIHIDKVLSCFSFPLIWRL